MIPPQKLRKMRRTTAFRKCALLLEQSVDKMEHKDPPNPVQLRDLLLFMKENSNPKSQIPARVDQILEDADQMSARDLISLRNLIEKEFNLSVADWDLKQEQSFRPENETAESTDNQNQRNLFIDDIRSPFNLGSIFRSGEAFGVNRIFLSEDCPEPNHPRAIKSSRGTSASIPHQTIPFKNKKDFLNSQAQNLTVFALECGGTSIGEFTFPDKGLAIIGSEELGVSPEALEVAKASGGIVSIPMSGKKGSINVSTATGIMLSRWQDFLLAKANKESV